ncbi:MAG: zinc ABC transporter substrate-binding protein [Kiritimatiellales bacterium]|nr:zinc ABC transporter substrate-binding protein [Kiritimatiellales bacterium]
MKGSLYILAALLLFGCSEKQKSPASDRPLLFVSILPQAGLAKAIAGDLVEIRTLVGAGQSPHAYEPTARQLARLGDADALLTIGVPFEKHLLKKIVPLYPDLPIIETQAGIALLEMMDEHDHDEAEEHDHGGKDPHIWLSPLNDVAIAHYILAALAKIDPVHAAIYLENYQHLAAELSALDTDIREKLRPFKGSRFYVFHPSFGYFAAAYGLEQIPVELDGKAPSPRQLVALIEHAKADGVKVVFVQKQFPSESARAMAEAIDGAVVQLDPLAEDSIANLRLIADSIEQALGNRN